MTKYTDSSGQRWSLLRKHEIRDLIDQDEIYLTRYKIIQTPLFSLLVHKIHRPDADRSLHDHPWSFITLVVKGGYREKRKSHFVDYENWRPGSIHAIRHGDFHAIQKLRATPTWTVVLTGRRKSDWGYQTTHGYIPHEAYHAMRRAGIGL